MSMTSRSYRFFKCRSQIRLILSIASPDFAVDPLTYKRKTYFVWREWEPGRFSSPANSGFRSRAGPLSFEGFFMYAFLSRVSVAFADPGHQQLRAVGQVSNDLIGAVPEAFPVRVGIAAICHRAPVVDSIPQVGSIRSDSSPPVSRGAGLRGRARASSPIGPVGSDVQPIGGYRGAKKGLQTEICNPLKLPGEGGRSNPHEEACALTGRAG